MMVSLAGANLLSMQDKRPGREARRICGCRDIARATQWCFHRTHRDARLAKRAGRAITSKNLRRLLLRRLWVLVDGWEME